MALSEAEPAVSTGAPRSTDAAAAQALWVGVIASVFVYVLLYFLGFRFFIYKTVVMPVFVIYGATLRDRRAFLADWLPFLSGTVLFDALRGAIFIGVQHRILPLFAVYAIDLEKAIFGTPAVPLLLQRARSTGLDTVAVILHGLHFAFFLLFGLITWHLNRSQFDYFRRVLLLTMMGGLMGYAIVPTVPPWLAASDLHLLPPIDHVVARIYTHYLPELYGAFDSNPVAAMPSLHAAFPVACTIVAWRALGRRVALITGVYAASVIFAVMYLGEHYAVDALAGVLLAVGASRLGMSERAAPMTLAKSIMLSAVTLSVTIVVLLITR